MAEQKYAGYEKIIKNKDSIPEIVPENGGLITIRIPSNLSESGINLDEIMDSMYYIRLETDTSALIGDIDKLLFCDDIIVVIERIKRQSILLFSRQGKFIGGLGIQGRGPGANDAAKIHLLWHK
ncbi:MAG: 6-bladed beta-propeller [Mangrovibacterium sp.]